MGRKKKKNSDVGTPFDENHATEGADARRANPRLGKDLSCSPKTLPEFSKIDEDSEVQCDGKEKSLRKSLKDSHKRRLFGRPRIPSESPNRRDCRKERVGHAIGDKTLILENGNNKNKLPTERLSRKEKFYSDNPVRSDSKVNKYKEVPATVDSSNEEMRHGKVGRVRKSRRDLFNATETRRRRLSKSPFRVPRRCPLLKCLESSKSISREQKENSNDNRIGLEMSHTKDTSVKQTLGSQSSSRDESYITGKSKCSRSGEKKTKKRQRMRKIHKTKRSKDQKKISIELQVKEKSKTKTNILNCCWNKTKESEEDQDNETSEGNHSTELIPIATELVKPYETEEVISESKTEKVISESKTEKVISEFKTEKVISESKTEKVISESKTEKAISESKMKKLTEDKPSGTSEDNYPEELNPFADESVSDVISIAEGHTLQSTEEKVTAVMDDKRIYRKQEDYPEHLNPFAEDETSEAISTQPSEPKNSQNDCLNNGVKKCKSGFWYRKLKAKRNLLSKNKKGDSKRYPFCHKTITTKEKSYSSLISSVGKDIDKDKVNNDKKSRKCGSSWKKLKTRNIQVTDNTSDATKSKDNTPIDKDMNSVTSLTNSPVDLQDRAHKKKKSWRSRFHVRKTKCEKIKKTDKPKSNSADHLTKPKTSKKLGRKQKKATQEKDEVLVNKASENMEDEKFEFRSKYLQNLNPLTAAQTKSSAKERRVPKSKLDSRSDTKIKKRRWWKIGKRQKPCENGENGPKKDQRATDREKSDNRDGTNQPKKKMSSLKKLEKTLKSRRKNELTTNPEPSSVVCAQESENHRQSSAEVKDKWKVESDKQETNSSSKKTGLTDNAKQDSKRRSPFAKLRRGWTQFNQWLDK